MMMTTIRLATLAPDFILTFIRAGSFAFGLGRRRSIAVDLVLDATGADLVKEGDRSQELASLVTDLSLFLRAASSALLGAG